MAEKKPAGWKEILEGYPWFEGEGNFPLPAYSEFMPPPRLLVKPLEEQGEMPCGEGGLPVWRVTELEEETELAPGLQHLAGILLPSLGRFSRGDNEPHIHGRRGANVAGNPYWPGELRDRASSLPETSFVTLLPLALSRTQDDKGRVRWTLFGGSDLGPEASFWNGFAGGREGRVPEFFSLLLRDAYGVAADGVNGLLAAGLRIMPSLQDKSFPSWSVRPPPWAAPFVISDTAPLDSVRFILTFRPFSLLPDAVREKYLSGGLGLIPFPGSLVFFGMEPYRRLAAHLPMGMQVPVLRCFPRRTAQGGIMVPQSGWLDEPRQDRRPTQLHNRMVVSTYHRTHRMAKTHRFENDLENACLDDRVTRILFSSDPSVMGLYGKPMARNCQIWDEQYRLVLDGPRAGKDAIRAAYEKLAQGGDFGYRFLFPAMRVGLHEVFWHRPLAAFMDPASGKPRTLNGAPEGFLTATRADDPAAGPAVVIEPRILARGHRIDALRAFDERKDLYARQTALNALTLFHVHEALGGEPLDRDFARGLLRAAKSERLEQWLETLPQRAMDNQAAAAARVESALASVLSAEGGTAGATELLTFGRTATRQFEESYWNTISELAHGRFVCKDNADPVHDKATRERIGEPRRDLDPLADLLIERHSQAITEAGMQGRALCGDLPFSWSTDHEFKIFGGWLAGQAPDGRERNVMCVIPGRDRSQAVVMADHYDTAYMEDVYDSRRGGTGARAAASGADDNHSATAALLLAAPVFLDMSSRGLLERDVWLLHLTGEEFPSDCLGARAFCKALVEKTLRLRLPGGRTEDLRGTKVAAAFVLDMIAHNRQDDLDTFQISPGRGAGALAISKTALDAALSWNRNCPAWNQGHERRGRGRAKRCGPDFALPCIAKHPHLHAEVRTWLDPRSSLFNTDGQIFSDVGVPTVLFMENYDINRSGYHDTRDTMENIDLDYGAAIAAIAIETVARCAKGPNA